jgi:putative transposase
MRFAFVEEHSTCVPVARLCRLLQVTSRDFRAWRNRPVSNRQRYDMVLLAHIHEQHHLSLGSYGRPRVTQELKEIGLAVEHRRVGRLMRMNGFRIVRICKYKATTDSNHSFNVAPNWLDRNFHADQPNVKWAGDITYIWTAEGWLYLAVMMDLHSRRVVDWATSNRLKRDLALQALNNAAALRNPPQGCMHHTDRGSQYCSHDYQKRLREAGFKVSMSGKGNCYDNAAVENFFKTLKAELIWRHTWATRANVSSALFQYINGFYNTRRKHSAKEGTSPLKFERLSA